MAYGIKNPCQISVLRYNSRVHVQNAEMQKFSVTFIQWIAMRFLLCKQLECVGETIIYHGMKSCLPKHCK